MQHKYVLYKLRLLRCFYSYSINTEYEMRLNFIINSHKMCLKQFMYSYSCLSLFQLKKSSSYYFALAHMRILFLHSVFLWVQACDHFSLMTLSLTSSYRILTYSCINQSLLHITIFVFHVQILYFVGCSCFSVYLGYVLLPPSLELCFISLLVF